MKIDSRRIGGICEKKSILKYYLSCFFFQTSTKSNELISKIKMYEQDVERERERENRVSMLIPAKITNLQTNFVAYFEVFHFMLK